MSEIVKSKKSRKRHAYPSDMTGGPQVLEQETGISPLVEQIRVIMMKSCLIWAAVPPTSQGRREPIILW